MPPTKVTLGFSLLVQPNAPFQPTPPPQELRSMASSSPDGSPPQPKKVKVSSPSSAEEETHQSPVSLLRPPLPVPPLCEDGTKPRYKRRKLAIFFGYCGHGYQGMQKNPGAKTIESDLEDALYLSFAVPELDRGLPRRYDWARSARTDKGVSAAGQVVSGRFYADPPGLVHRLNSHLSPQIRIFGYKRVTASFNAKKFCDRRKYVYLLPLFALDPDAHPDRVSVLASFGSGNELTKCGECSERGRKVPGLMGRSAASLGCGGDSEVSSLLAGANEADVCSVDPLPMDEEEEEKVGNSCFERSSLGGGTCYESSTALGEDEKDGSNIGKDASDGVDKRVSEGGMVSFQSNLMIGNGDNNNDRGFHELQGTPSSAAQRRRKFVYGEEEKQRFNGILKRYVGTHNFHNFTTRTKAEDPSARRYILSFDANAVVTINGIDFAKCVVVGQSFMLHQIRKMIGLAVAIMRNCTPESILDTALRTDVRITVPTAPEVGLYLEECLFTSYNQKWKDTHEQLSMDCYSNEAEEFKMRYIYSHIASMEQKEGSVALWLHSLNHRNYPDLLCKEVSVSNGSAPIVQEPSHVESKRKCLSVGIHNDELQP